jgi:hypothetical protein
VDRPDALSAAMTVRPLYTPGDMGSRQLSDRLVALKAWHQATDHEPSPLKTAFRALRLAVFGHS